MAARNWQLGVVPVLLTVLLLATVTARTSPRILQATTQGELFAPDIDTTSLTRLPRVPNSPYGTPDTICPALDGSPYSVGGFPGTPYLARPFSNSYRSPVNARQDYTACRTVEPNSPAHCLIAYHTVIKAAQLRPWDTALPGCQAHPPTNFLTYNGSVPGPLITAPV